MPNNLFGEAVASIGEVNHGFNEAPIGIINIDSGAFSGYIQSMTVARAERVQEVTCFNDFTHIYTFGRTPLRGSLTGFALLEGDNSIVNLIKSYDDSYRAFNNKLIPLTMNGGENIKLIVTSFEYNIDANTPVMVNFSLTFLAFTNQDSVSDASAGSTGGATARSTPSA